MLLDLKIDSDLNCLVPIMQQTFDVFPMCLDQVFSRQFLAVMFRCQYCGKTTSRVFMVQWSGATHEACLLYLNWSAPSTVKNATQAAQAGAAAFILGQSGRNVGMMLCPDFTYRKNELWLLEHAITKMLCHKGVSLDRSFTLQFQSKAWPLLMNEVN